MSASASKTTLLRALLATTALGGALGVHVAPARAADECGPPVAGVVTCLASGGHTAISYTGVTADTTINLEAGVAAETLLLEGVGDLTVNAGAGSRFDAVGANVRAIDVQGEGGVVTIDADAVSATGDGAIGIAARNDGDITIDAGEVQVSGVESIGISAISSAGGAVGISADKIVATRIDDGRIAHGIYADGGDVTVNVGSIEVTGGSGVAIDKAGRVDISIEKISVTNGSGVSLGYSRYPYPFGSFESARVVVGEIELNGGTGAGGIATANDPNVEWGIDFDIGSIRGVGRGFNFYTTSDVRLVVDEIATTGAGIGVSYADDVSIIAGYVATTDDNASAISIGSNSVMAAVIQGGMLTTLGDGSIGIQISNTAEAVITSESIATFGDDAHGIHASNIGVLAIDVGAITTTGEESYGVLIEGSSSEPSSNISLAADSIQTAGQYAGGVFADVYADTLTFDLGTVTTAGDQAGAIVLRNANGSVAGHVGTITTTGEESGGLELRGISIDATFDDIATEGHNATGVSARTDGGAMVISGGSIRTAGDYAYGADLISDTSILFDVDSVLTEGDNSVGIRAEILTEYQILPAAVIPLMDLKAGQVETRGERATGVLIYSEGAARVTVGSITTSGDESDGLYIGHGDTADETIVDIGSISTSGRQSHGAYFNGSGGDYSGRIGAVQTTGESAHGVVLGGDSGSAYALELGSVTTSGDFAKGIQAPGASNGLTATLSLKADAVTTSGFNAHGIDLDRQDMALDIGAIVTSGAASGGVVLTSNEAALDGTAIRGGVDSITTTGEGSHGAVIATTGRFDLAFGSIHTAGPSAKGISAYADGGGLIKANSILTEGDDARGAHVISTLGGFDARFGSVETRGDDADGVYVESLGDSLVHVASARTLGDRSAGVVVTGGGGVYDLKVGALATSGEESDGVVLGGIEGARFTVELGDITTTGDVSTAVTTDFDGLSGRSASLILKANTISTAGEDARGLYLYAYDLDVEVGKLTTTGDYATGAYLASNGVANDVVAIKSRFGQIETTGYSAEGLGVGTTGRFDINIGSVHTRGEDSSGFRAYAAGGGLLTIGNLLTEGDYAVGARLESPSGGFDAAFATIETRGVGAHGVHLQSLADSTVAAGKVRTSGSQARGIVAAVSDGDLTIGAEDVGTTGAGATGVDVTAGGDIALALGSVEATGSEADAVVANAAGDVRLAATGRLASTSGAAANLSGETIDVTLASTTVVAGGTAGLLLASQDGSTITNGGSISSTGGYAIEAESGKVTLNNGGLISGRVRFSGADDVVNNAGRFTASGISEFGAGSDVFNNVGVIDLATGTTPRTAEFSGLERLNNTGTISLANGVAGDVFTVSGTLNGQGANTIALDLDLRGATPLADQIVAGEFAGLSHIMLSVQGEAVLGETGVVVARSGSTQTGQEIDVDVAGGGFVDYSLLLSGNAYTLNGELALPAFEPTKIASGAQHQWTSGADVVSARFEQMRDGGVREGQGLQVWSQAFDGSSDIDAERTFEIEGETVDADLTHEVKSRGVQAGLDQTVPIAQGSLAFGVLVSTGRTELRFQNGDRTRYDGAGVGAYGHWSQGPLSVGALAKIDRFDLDYDWAQAGMKTRADGFTVGMRVDAAWRIDLGDAWYVEPQASVSWADTALDRIKSSTGEVEFGDTRSLVGKIGLRAGGVVAVADGLTLRPYAGIHALNEFEGDNASKLHLGSETIEVRDEAHGAWGRATLGASLGGAVGLGGFIQAEQDFGDVDGFTARAGVRYAW